MPREPSRRATRPHVQQGQSLPLALLALAVGVLLGLPLLHHVRARQATSERLQYAQRSQYAADAGLEYGLHRLQHDEAWRVAAQLLAPGGVTTDLPAPVNGLAVSVRAAGTVRPFNYALWGNSQTCSSVMEWTGAKNRLVGNAHSNRGIKVQGADIVLEGIIEYVTDLETHPSVVYVPSEGNPRQTHAQDMPTLFALSEYGDPTAEGTAAHAAASAGRYHRIDGDLHVNESGYQFDGLYYVTGSLKINGNDIGGRATFVALGTIEVVGSNLGFDPYVHDLAFFSAAAYTGASRCTTPVITVSGSGVSMLGGYVYAPNGLIRVSGSGTLSGAFVGDAVELSGSGLTITLPPLPGVPDGCEAFDLMSTAGDARGTARVLLCAEPPAVRILAWRVAPLGQSPP